MDSSGNAQEEHGARTSPDSGGTPFAGAAQVAGISPEALARWAQAAQSADASPQSLAEFINGRVSLRLDDEYLARGRNSLPRWQYDCIYFEPVLPDMAGILVGHVKRMARHMGDFLTRFDHWYFRKSFGDPFLDTVEGYYLWIVNLDCPTC